MATVYCKADNVLFEASDQAVKAALAAGALPTKGPHGNPVMGKVPEVPEFAGTVAEFKNQFETAPAPPGSGIFDQPKPPVQPAPPKTDHELLLQIAADVAIIKQRTGPQAGKLFK